MKVSKWEELRILVCAKCGGFLAAEQRMEVGKPRPAN